MLRIRCQFATVRVLAVLFVLAQGAAARGDIIRLKSGGQLEGSIVKRADGQLQVRTRFGTSVIQESDVAAIEPAEVPWEVFRERAAQLQPGDADGHFQLARYGLKHGLQEEALTELRAALTARPDFADARKALSDCIDPLVSSALSRAESALSSGEANEAQKLLEQAIESYPESQMSGRAQDRLASLYAEQGNLEAALKLWQEVLRADPSRTSAYLGVARIAERRGLWHEAVQLYESILRSGAEPEAKDIAATRRRAMNELIAALGALAARPKDPELLVTLGRRYQDLDQEERAIESFAAAVEAGARDRDVLGLLAHHFTDQLDLEPALRYWGQLSEFAADPAATEEARSQLARLRTLQLIPRFLAADNPDDIEKLREALSQAPLPYDLVARMIAKGPSCQPQPSGFSAHKLLVGLEQVEVYYALYVPESYRPERAAPLLLALHPLRTEADAYLGLWRAAADEHGYILLAPATYGGEWFARGASIVHACVAEVCRRYHIDSNRIHLVGASLGGEGALQAAPLRPHLFASIAILAGGVQGKPSLLLPNLRDVPTYVVHGARDQVVPVELAREVVQKLRLAGTDVMYVEIPHAEHSAFAAEWRNVINWFDAHPRSRYPAQVTILTNSPLAGQAYWVRAARLSERAYDPDFPLIIQVPPAAASMLSPEVQDRLINAAVEERLARIDASLYRPANRIDLVTRNVAEVEVFLSDALLNLDRPVAIQINGEKVFEQKVAPSALFALDQARRTGDYGMPFAAAVRLAVPGMP